MENESMLQLYCVFKNWSVEQGHSTGIKTLPLPQYLASHSSLSPTRIDF